MAKSNKTCAACHAVQKKLEEDAHREPQTLHCFAGLCETAIPVRVGGSLVAFLKTGQVLTHQPNATEFRRITQALIAWGSQVDVKQAEEAYFSTRVLTAEQYEALVRLLTIFAGHLSAFGDLLALEQQKTEPSSIQKARSFIAAHSGEEISLPQVAHAVNMSAHYFSQRFHEVTGLKFTEFVSRTRIEKARVLLENPNLQVSEVAYDVGFQSLSQFNRAFRQVAGTSPTAFRQTKGIK